MPTSERSETSYLPHGAENHSAAPTIAVAAPHDPPAHVPVHAAPNTGKWLLVLVVLLAIGLSIGFFFVHHRRGRAEAKLAAQAAADAAAPPPVDVVPVVYASATRDLQLPGECRAWYETTIYGRVNGYVKKWFVDIGDRVKEGQILATIETPELDQQLAASEGKVKSDEAQITLAKAAVHFSQVTFGRYEDAPKGVVSDLERDSKAADRDTSAAKLAAAQSDLASAQAQVDQIQDMIAFQKVTAPFDGVITERRVDIGDLVTAGSTANTTSLFRLVQDDQIRVFVDVPESAAPQIHDGDRATATADEFPGRTFVGHVARTAGEINTASKTLRVEVDIPNQDVTLLPGMYVRVSFETKEAHPDLEVPASAVTFRAAGPEIAVVDKQGRVTFKKVTIDRDLGDVVEIADGLAPDDQVALNISDQVADGDTVKVNLVQTSGQAAPTATPAAAHVVAEAAPPPHARG